MIDFIEVRHLNLKPSMREEFHCLPIQEALPLLQRRNFDVVTDSYREQNPHDIRGVDLHFFFNLAFGSATCLLGTRGL